MLSFDSSILICRDDRSPDDRSRDLRGYLVDHTNRASSQSSIRTGPLIPSTVMSWTASQWRSWELTVFGRSLLLIFGELMANAVCWILAGILFGRKQETREILSLCLLAWTLGLRHGLDADHISAIDNATRGLINLGQLPVTCGLFFSLGHSTIVIVVNIAIAISTDVYNKIEGVGQVGGIIGASVSATFLFVIGLANSIILFKIIRERRRRARQQLGEGEVHQQQFNDNFFMMRILGPVTRFVDRPWKMYPVGVLFGFGFDTASSIALLAVTAIAKRDSNGRSRISHGNIIILPLLFTAGMTLVDSIDSILMLYSYAGVTEKGLSPLRRLRPGEPERDSKPPTPQAGSTESVASRHSPSPIQRVVVTTEEDNASPTKAKQDVKNPELRDVDEEEGIEDDARKASRLKQNTMSKLSIILTLLSILVAFSISLITIMGLISENCRKCREAAEAEDGGGLAGRWWRGWAKANDQSGWIGAAIVGTFLLVVVGYYGGLWIRGKLRPRRETNVDA